ncbi:MAG: glycoside hydrolase family 27 protein [Clostridia bacterium]|nr:glycoside hydrolase family 27 protein [Clostridia bacterium]
MISYKPPLGWNSWNYFGKNVSERIITETADAIVETGLKDAGYEYVIIDDGWQAKQRAENGRLVPDPLKFPNGIKAVADYVHGKGLKFGLYSCAGLRTCADYPGSYDHEFEDAETFAEWGVDYLKYDFCHFPVYDHEQCWLFFRRMGTALAGCGRKILFAACNWGINGAREWIKTSGATTWRSTLDIVDTWESIKSIALSQNDIQPYNGLGCFNDLDMLTVGMKGRGNVGITGCTENEYRTQMSFWALMNSPLIIGTDVRDADENTLKMLKNRMTLEINQDPAGRQPFMTNRHREHPVWARLLDSGKIAVGCFNFTDSPSCDPIILPDYGLARVGGKNMILTDVWTEETFEVSDILCRSVEPHGVNLYIGEIKNA